jgi:hypothetical protein
MVAAVADIDVGGELLPVEAYPTARAVAGQVDLG